ncbi:uncharacterized mitochondrial protein AtMg00310-like [Quercus suber]|uniref:uncharacterized mitochondrial protein AtMg00310-like n=1 Tax=Quercus suber TaxID=58331 RepID=UPI000CE21F6E|nr:uncharacterized protein LOC111991883 [Quercus suber]
MGFKEIEKFNEALLAKQVWQMIHNPEFLCFRVFKARFFPNCSILDAKDSNSSSYAWKSILGARDVIRKGMVWCIGDGQTVRIKEDKWLPVKPSRVILSSLPSVMAEAKVRDELRMEMFATIAWCLWNRQNALHFGRPAHPIANISSVAGALLQDFIAS